MTLASQTERVTAEVDDDHLRVYLDDGSSAPTGRARPMGEQIVERTGSTRFVMVGGRHVGAAMVEQIANIVVNHKDEPPTRNAARRTLPGNQSRGRVYKALQSCIDAGLLEYVVPANGPQGSFPRLKVTTAGYEAMLLWNEPAAEAI